MLQRPSTPIATSLAVPVCMAGIPKDPMNLSASVQYHAVVEALTDPDLVRGSVFIVSLAPQTCTLLHSCTKQGRVGILVGEVDSVLLLTPVFGFTIYLYNN